MSDMSVPGIGAGNYDKLIEALMKKERVPRDNAAEDLKKYEQQDALWRKIGYFSNEVRDKTRELYSFNNPFVEKIVESSDERALTAVASRDAQVQSFKIAVKNIAQPDVFLSTEIASDYQVPKGTYTFAVGEKKITFDWSGGKYRTFIALINKKGKDILHVGEIKTGKDSNALLFQSRVSGESHKLTFSDDALTFALDNGLIKKNDAPAVAVSKTQTLLLPQSSETVEFAKSVRATQDYVLEYTVTIKAHADPAAQPVVIQTPPEGSPAAQLQPVAPAIPSETAAVSDEQTGEISYQGITIHNDPSSLGPAGGTLRPPLLPSGTGNSTAAPNVTYIASGTPPVTNDFNALSLISTKGLVIPLASLADTGEPQTFTVRLSEYGDIRGMALANKNVNKAFEITNITVRDPKAQGDFIPVNPVSQAQDAEFTFEGITVRREKNEVDDLIPGVTLRLHERTEKNETIDIKPDTDAAKNAIIELVAKYNRLLAEINIVTSKQQAVIDEITYFTDEEKKTAEENLGILFGNTTLSALKNKLRNIVSGVYRKNDNASIRSLAEIGISTQSDSSSGMNESRLRGYLEIDEKKLDAALKNSMQDVRFLFGYDTDSDILIDDGVAFQLFTQIDPYTQRGGIFSTYTTTLSAEMKTAKDAIARYDKQLEKKEAELKQKYGVMDASLRKLQKQSAAIENLTKQNKN